MTTTLLPYDRWLEEALRSVIRRALSYTAEYGLPGAHHFYVTFQTGAEGVQLPADLRARYPEEMTIVLQHQFWDLVVDDEGFSVTLSFRGRPTRLSVPLAAITAFGDPSVNFGLKLKGADAALAPEPSEVTEESATNALLAAPPEPEDKSGEGKVIALDTFRKK